MALEPHVIQSLPKVALHDHLDGGVRPQTLLDIAAEVGHTLPVGDAESLGHWFFEAADSGTLVRYLETFDHTIAVMQRAEDLHRIAREFVEDQTADGVVYAEARWAPEQHLAGGLSLSEAVEAVRVGLAEGMVAASQAGQTIVARQIISAMRQNDRGLEIAELAVAHRRDLVGGFDIAGPELGFPPERLGEAFRYLQRHNLPYTIHAGEADGLESIWQAVQLMRADRIGHGVRIIDDVEPGPYGEWQVGELAAYIRDRRIALEVCPTSNLQTGIAPSYAQHPFGVLDQLGFNLTVSCDNRLMSGTTLTEEFSHLSSAFGYGVDDLYRFTLNALDAAFLSGPERANLQRDVVDPAYMLVS